MASEYVGGGASDSSINEVSCIGPGATSGTSVKIKQKSKYEKCSSGKDRPLKDRVLN